jgi:hypothetical protein
MNKFYWGLERADDMLKGPFKTIHATRIDACSRLNQGQTFEVYCYEFSKAQILLSITAVATFDVQPIKESGLL